MHPPREKTQEELQEEEEEEEQRMYAAKEQMEYAAKEKTHDELQEQGYIQNFFECPQEYQKVIFMMVNEDQQGLSQSRLYLESQEIFDFYY